ncbi:MAG: hypothetical protein ACRD9R_06395 [Pyrinomonadaceae bacterium]
MRVLIHSIRPFTTVFGALICLSLPVFAQEDKGPLDRLPPPVNAVAADGEKAEQIIRRAIEAHGGQAYLAVRALVGRGYFTQFRDGVSGSPLTFTDYFVFPDRERTEFRGAGNLVIQTNTGATGWLLDREARTVKEMKPEQVEDFRTALRTSLDNLLRGWWRKDGAKLTYLGRREAGLGRRNEAVRLAYPEGFAIDFEFGAKDGLASKTFYKRVNAEGEEVTEEDRYARLVTVGGVTLPFIIDHYRAGVQSSRISYDSVQFNPNVPDALFERPANAKSVK